MNEKRFILIDGVKKGTHSGIWDNLKRNNQRVGDELWVGEVVAMLNEGIAIVKENEQLKTIRSDLICELDIVQNELNIAIDKGFAPTTPYKNYMASKKTEYDKFWENKIKTHNNRLNGVRE